jgi:hypothetical protein
MVEMELKPSPRPLPCFGSEFKEGDAMCVSCQYRTDCKVAMGCRLNKVPLSKIRFNLIPEILQTSSDIVNPENNVHTLFYTCHDAIFNKPSKFKIPAGGSEKIVAASQEAECSLKLFITAVMMAHHQMAPFEPFYPAMLFGKSAIKKVNMYRTACREKYGHFDIGSFNMLRGKNQDVDDLESKMLRSEILFGELIVGCRLTSDESPFKRIYQLREMGFDPVWLAIEETYRDVLDQHSKSESLTSNVIATLRHNVFQVKKSLRANKPRLIETFKIRQDIMPKAVQQVLSYHRLSPNDFEIDDSPVVSANKFWLVLGKALNHFYCWRAIDGDKYAMSKISKGE